MLFNACHLSESFRAVVLAKPVIPCVAVETQITGFPVANSRLRPFEDEAANAKASVRTSHDDSRNVTCHCSAARPPFAWLE